MFALKIPQALVLRLSQWVKMGNCIQKRKFLVKNETEFQIFFMVTEKKLNLDVEDIRPGKVVSTIFNTLVMYTNTL